MTDDDILHAAEQAAVGGMTPDAFVALGLSDETLAWVLGRASAHVLAAVGESDLALAQAWLALVRRIESEGIYAR